MKLDEPQALNLIAAYCSKAERCEFDVRRKLARWEIAPEAIERIVGWLRKERFLDDARFARGFVNDKLRFNKWGKVKIIYELKKRKISESDYQDALNEFDNIMFDEQLLHILRVKVKSVRSKDRYDKRNKLIRFALGRGFAMDSAIKLVDKVIDENME